MHGMFATLSEMLCLFSTANPFFLILTLFKAFLFLSEKGKNQLLAECVGQQVPMCSVLNAPRYATCLNHCVLGPMCLQPASGDPGDEQRPSLAFYWLLCNDNVR